MKLHIFSTCFALCAMVVGGHANATTFPTTTQPFSKYGQIQNVQNYSSNPFWNPNSPYNQRMPQPVYVQGADLNTGDCQRVVAALVASYCATRNNCMDESLSDAKPTLTVQLASLPNHNYVAACAGFIDSEFQSYISQRANAAPTGKAVAFPSATTPNTAATENNFEIKNPYEMQLPTWNGEPWLQEMIERKQELQNLQSQNGAGTETIAKADFPATVADLSFTERMENAAAGYEPYRGKSAYQQLNIESEETYRQRQQSYCGQEIAKLSILNADLATLQNCRSKGTSYNDCQKLLQGTY